MQKPLLTRLKKLPNNELYKELSSHEHNDSGRAVVLYEISRRESSKITWYVWLSIVIGIISLSVSLLANKNQILCNSQFDTSYCQDKKNGRYNQSEQKNKLLSEQK